MTYKPKKPLTSRATRRIVLSAVSVEEAANQDLLRLSWGQPIMFVGQLAKRQRRLLRKRRRLVLGCQEKP